MNDSIHSYGYHVVVVVVVDIIASVSMMMTCCSCRLPPSSMSGGNGSMVRDGWMDGWTDEGGVWIADRARNE